MFPKSVKGLLWSYDLDKVDLSTHQNQIITLILNLGTTDAVDWMKQNYAIEDIKKVVAHPIRGWWNKKSWNYWRLIFNLPHAQLPTRYDIL